MQIITRAACGSSDAIQGVARSWATPEQLQTPAMDLMALPGEGGALPGAFKAQLAAQLKKSGVVASLKVRGGGP